MTNTDMLNDKIAQRGVKKRHIAKALNISETSLRNKIYNRQDFRQGEIEAITSTLGLTAKERDNIFFARKVGK